MKRFKFRLDPVLRVRRLEEERARLALIQANEAARESASKVDAALHAYLVAPRPTARMTYDDFEFARFRFEQAARSLEQARAAHRAALDEVDAKRVAWTEAKQRVGTLERLEERRRAEYAIDVRRAEDKLIDDLTLARHRLRVGEGALQ